MNLMRQRMVPTEARKVRSRFIATSTTLTNKSKFRTKPGSPRPSSRCPDFFSTAGIIKYLLRKIPRPSGTKKNTPNSQRQRFKKSRWFPRP